MSSSLPLSSIEKSKDTAIAPKLFGALRATLDGMKIGWVVLHQQNLDCQPWTGDLDLCVEQPLTAPQVKDLLRGLQDRGYVPLLAFYTAVNQLIVYVASEQPGVSGDPFYAQIDIAHDIVGRANVQLLSAAEVFAEIDKSSDIPQTNPAMRFAYLLAKRVLKRQPTEEQLAELRRCFDLASAQSSDWARRLLGDRADQVVHALHEPGAEGRTEGSNFANELSHSRRSLYWQGVRRSGLRQLRNTAGDGRRLARRLRRPSGLSIAFLGPDGSGKTTVISGIAETLRPGFVGVVRGHLRPTVLPAAGELLDPTAWRRSLRPWEPGPAVDPPSANDGSGVVVSLLRIAYYAVDYVVGFGLRVYLPAVRNRLVLFDRYHPDIMAHPERWKIRLPDAIRSNIVDVLPDPTLYVLVHADLQRCIDHAGPNEAVQVADRLERYRQFVLASPRGRIVDGTQSAGDVVAQTRLLIMDTQSRRSIARFDTNKTARGIAVLSYRTGDSNVIADIEALVTAGFELTSLSIQSAHDHRPNRRVFLTIEVSMAEHLPDLCSALQSNGATASMVVSSEMVTQLIDSDASYLQHPAMADMQFVLCVPPNTAAQTAVLRQAKSTAENQLARAITCLVIDHPAPPPELMSAAWQAGFTQLVVPRRRFAEPGLGPFLVPFVRPRNTDAALRIASSGRRRPPARYCR